MGDDDDRDCPEHVWVLAEVGLSLARGAEQVKHCERCGATAYVPDPARAPGRPPL